MSRLLDMCGVRPSARSITFEAVSGYSRRFPLDDAKGYLLAVAVGGVPFDHNHGSPVRLVADQYRGFQWVKWITLIRVNETSELLQPPVPLQ